MGAAHNPRMAPSCSNAGAPAIDLPSASFLGARQWRFTPVFGVSVGRRDLVGHVADGFKGAARDIDDGFLVLRVERCLVHLTLECRPFLPLPVPVGIEIGKAVTIQAPASAKYPGEESAAVGAALEDVKRSEQGNRPSVPGAFDQ